MSELVVHVGYVALVGKPNVGKSSLINTLVGQVIAPVTFRAQTTRRNQLGILSTEKAQIIFLDTPGIHKPVNKLGTFMNDAAEVAIQDCDLIAVICDISQDPSSEDVIVADRLKTLRKRKSMLIIGNKSDLVTASNQVAMLQQYHSLYQCDTSIPVSATTGWNISELIDRIVTYLPIGEPLFENDQVTDLYERDIAGELIRAACLRNLREEVPYSVAVRVDNFKERESGIIYIEATVFVEKDSQKGIVIGRNGMMLKSIGMDARQSIEELLGGRVYLDLHVKVEKNWRNNPLALKRFGYRLE